MISRNSKIKPELYIDTMVQERIEIDQVKSFLQAKLVKQTSRIPLTRKPFDLLTLKSILIPKLEDQ